MRTFHTIMVFVALIGLSAWIGALLHGIWLRGFEPLGVAAKSDCDVRLVAQFAFRNALDFEHDNHLRSRFDNCLEDAGVQHCSATTESGAPVVYHCDVTRCAVDCDLGLPVKP